MSAFVLLLACLGAGALLVRANQAPSWLSVACDSWVLKLALPALVLRQIPSVSLDAGLIYPALAPWGVILGALILFPLLGRLLQWPRALVGCLILTCGFGNTAFLGLPMIAALRGDAALPIAAVADQAGSFLALSTIGLAVAAAYGGTALRPLDIALRVLRFPPFIALLIALLVAWAGGWPTPVLMPLELLGATLAPVALFSVGLRFRMRRIHGRGLALALGLGWKLLLAPLLLLGVAATLGLHGPAVSVAVLQTAMAPMITAGILAMQNDLEPRLAATLLSGGILLSFLSVPLWHLLLP